LVRIVGLEFSHKFLSLGGYSDGSYLDIAAKMEEISFDRAIWTNVGTLLTKRECNRSIVVDNGNFQNKKTTHFFCVDVFTPKVAFGEKNNFGSFRFSQSGLYPEICSIIHVGGHPGNQ